MDTESQSGQHGAQRPLNLPLRVCFVFVAVYRAGDRALLRGGTTNEFNRFNTLDSNGICAQGFCYMIS